MIKAAEAPAVRNFLSSRKVIIDRLKQAKVRAGTYWPQKLVLATGNKCDQACSHCFASASIDGGLPMTREISEIAMANGKELSIPMLVVTGGEPTQEEGVLSDVLNNSGDFYAVSLQTHGILDRDQQGAFRALINNYRSKIDSQQFQLNLSFNFDVNDARKSYFFGRLLFSWFYQNSLAVDRVVIESLIMSTPDEARNKLDRYLREKVGIDGLWKERLGDRLTTTVNFPVFLGRAIGLRGTSLADEKRRIFGPIDLEAYRGFESFSRTMEADDLAAVDPQGHVFPSGVFMYAGIYPIGDIRSETLMTIVEAARHDPIMIMMNYGRAGEIYEIARKIYPEFDGLPERVTDPLEVMGDILSDPNKALMIMDKAAERLIDGGS